MSRGLRIGALLGLLIAASAAPAAAIAGESIARLVRQLDDADPRVQREALEELATVDRGERADVLAMTTAASRPPVSHAQALLVMARMTDLDQPSPGSAFPARREDLAWSDDAVTRSRILHAVGELGVGDAEALELALLDLRDPRPRVRLAAAFLCRCAVESPAACLVDLEALRSTIDPRVAHGPLVRAGGALDRQALAAEPNPLPPRKVARARRALDAWLERERDPSLEGILQGLRITPPDPAMALVRLGGTDAMRWGVASFRAEGRSDDKALEAVLSQRTLTVDELAEWLLAVPVERLAARLADASDIAVEPLVDALAQRGESAMPSLLEALAQDDATARSRATWALRRIEPRPADLARRLVPVYAEDPRADELESLLIDLGAAAGPPLADAMRSLASDEKRVVLVQRLEDFGEAGHDALRVALHDDSPAVTLAAVETLSRAEADLGTWLPGIVGHLRVPATLEAMDERWFSPSVRVDDVYPDTRCPPPMSRQLHQAACDVVSDLDAEAVASLLEILRSDGSAERRAGAAVALHECTWVEGLPAGLRSSLAEPLLAAARDPVADVRAAAFAALSWCADTSGPRLLPAFLAGIQDGDPRVRRSAGGALRELARGTIAIAAPEAEALIRAVGSDDPLVASIAGGILAGAGVAIPFLASSLASDDLPMAAPWENDGDWQHAFGGPRDLAAAALVAHEPDPRVLAAEDELVLRGPVATRRAMTRALHLSRVTGPGRSLLIEAAARDPDARVRELALGAWREEQVPRERQAVLNFAAAQDESPIVRRRAALNLGPGGIGAAADAERAREILGSLARDADPSVARAAADSLEQRIVEPSEDEWLVIVRARICSLHLEDVITGGPARPLVESPSQQLAARLAAMPCAPPGSRLLDDLVAGLEPDDPTTRVRALEAIASLRVPDAPTVAVLERLARTGTGSAARRAAAQALARGSWGSREPASDARLAALERLAIDGAPEIRLVAAFALETANWRAAARSLLRLLGEGLAEPDRDAAAWMLARMASAWTSRESEPGVMLVGWEHRDFTSLLPDGPPEVRERAEKELARALDCPP